MRTSSNLAFSYATLSLAICGLLSGCDSALEALYGDRSRPNEEYCERDDQCGGPLRGCDPVLHRCSAVNVCLTGAEFCLANETPVCNGEMMLCEGCREDIECSRRWDSGYRSTTGSELRACFVHTGETAGRCAACAVDDKEDLRCPAGTPVCAEGSCRPCTKHADCASGICRTEVAFQEISTAALGTCVDKNLITEVATDADLSSALNDPRHPFIKLKLGSYSWPAVTQKGVFILVGEGTSGSDLIDKSGNVPQLPHIKAQNGVRLTLSQVRVSVASDDTAVFCDSNASLYIRDSILAGPESGNLSSAGIKAMSDCLSTDIQRVYIRRMKNAITIGMGSTYNLINLGITDSGVFNNLLIALPQDNTPGNFAYSTIANLVSGTIICGNRLKYSIIEDAIGGYSACLDSDGGSVLNRNQGGCLLPAQACPVSVLCRDPGIRNPGLLPETDFFGNSRLTTKAPLSCGWYQPLK